MNEELQDLWFLYHVKDHDGDLMHIFEPVIFAGPGKLQFLGREKVHKRYYLQDIYIDSWTLKSAYLERGSEGGTGRVEYRTYSQRLGLRDLEKMHKTIKSIERRLNTLYEKRGEPQSFGEYAARVMEIVGAEGIVTPANDNRHLNVRFIPDLEYRYHSIGDARWLVSQAIHDAFREDED